MREAHATHHEKLAGGRTFFNDSIKGIDSRPHIHDDLRTPQKLDQQRQQQRLCFALDPRTLTTSTLFESC